MDKNKDKLKRLGLEEKYYYLRFGEGEGPVRGVATVCLVGYSSPDGTRHYVRGVSFCSPKDQFNKKVGRAKALGRAIKALEHEASSEWLLTHNPTTVLTGLGIFALSSHSPVLTRYELKIMGEG